MRLDQALVARGLARSRSHARQLIDAGAVQLPGGATPTPATPVDDSTPLTVRPDPYVSRAAHKLIGALDATGLAIPPRVLDAGASTGGFTQVVLERGATHVYAVDVGHGQLAPMLRDDPRLTVREGLNLRDLTLADVGGTPVDLVVADVSFISLTLLLAPLFAVLSPEGSALLLVKPQFEVGRAGLDVHGVADAAGGVRAVAAVTDRAGELGWVRTWSAPSVLPGEKGNQEWFALFRRTGEPVHN